MMGMNVGFAPGQSYDADGNLVLSYQFGTATVSDEEAVVVPNDTLDVNTKLYNDKTLGELCDYLEAEVKEEGTYAENNGEINVTTFMFDDERISAWEDALDKFYGEN